MIKIDLQFFGGRGSSSGGGSGGGTGGVSSSDILDTKSLISEREHQKALVDETLSVFNDVYNDWGTQVEDIQLATMKPGSGALAYYDSNGNIAINEKYFNSKNMNKAYADSVKSGFHPSNGNKTALQAVAAHELGHALTEQVGAKLGQGGFGNINKTSNKVVRQAMKASGHKDIASFRSKISGYAKTNNAECIAEAFSDVFCNGSKARKESHAVVNTLRSYLNS